MNECAEKRRSRVLLIVEEDEAVCNEMARVLAREFDTIYGASSFLEAVRKSDNYGVTHVLCNHELDDDRNDVVDLLEVLCRRSVFIERVVVYGDDGSELLPWSFAVDGVLSREADRTEIRAALE